MTFEGFAELWAQTRSAWRWGCPFMLPFWLENVCRHLGCAGEAHIVTVSEGAEPIGSMPLALDGATATFLGSHEVCDYQDLVCAPGRQQQVLEAVLDHLALQGLRRLDMRTLRPDALVMEALGETAAQHSRLPVEVTFETELPDSWEAFLQQLGGKQRHEVRRKLRRLEDGGRIDYRCVADVHEVAPAADTFLDLFRRNRPDKAAFMTAAMEAYFRRMLWILADRRLLSLCFLEVDGQPAASVICIDYLGTRYLYNSGYDERFESLSVGSISKALSIRHAIESGCGRYDFLKGAEVYKKRLGGKETELYRCTIPI